MFLKWSVAIDIFPKEVFLALILLHLISLYLFPQVNDFT